MPVLKELNLQYITDEKGQKTAVIMKLADFEELIEDIEDLAIVAKRRDEKTISHETLLSELKADGTISD
jgi:hypothetical protein